MKILFISQRVPYPPDRGDRIPTYHFVKHMAERHDVHLFALAQEKGDLEKKNILAGFCKSVSLFKNNRWTGYIHALTGLFTLRPISVSLYYSKKMLDDVARAVREKKIDVIYVYSSNMCMYAMNIRGVKKIWNIGDVDSDKWRQLFEYSKNILKKAVFYYEWKGIGRIEKRLSAQEKYFVFHCETEKKKFRSYGTKESACYVIENGVDSRYFDADLEKQRRIEKRQALIFTGVLDYYLNIESVRSFVHEVFPLIVKQVPEACFYIAGKNPVREVRALDNNKNIFVVADPKDIREYFLPAKVAVVYMKMAQGFQNKILEALAMGVPVVTTRISYEGVAKDGFVGGAEIGESPADFAQKVVTLLKNDHHRASQSLEGAQFIRKHYSWDSAYSGIDELLKKVDAEG